MIVVKDRVYYVDVDQCLINVEDKHGNIILPINYKLIDKIKEWNSEGSIIIVWTSNGEGVTHAEKTVLSLGLKSYVFLCLPKPYTIVDDDHLEYYNTIDPVTLKYR